MANPNIEDNLFYSAVKIMPDPFLTKLKEFTSKLAINEKLIQVHKKWLLLMKSRIPASRTTSGIGSLPFGQNCMLPYVNNTNTMTPAEIHELGLNEVARLTAEMEKVKSKLALKDFIGVLNTRNKPELKPFKTRGSNCNFERIYTVRLNQM
jgi:uncharacterized protein (DUF885 family)